MHGGMSQGRVAAGGHRPGNHKQQKLQLAAHGPVSWLSMKVTARLGQ